MRHALLLAAVAASLGCGHPLLGADAEIEKITITTPPMAFPDVAALGTIAAGLDPQLLSTTVSFSYDVGSVPTDQKGVTPSLTLTGFALHLRSTAPLKPDGLREMDLMLVDPSTAATTFVAHWAGGSQPNPMDLQFTVPGIELMPFVAQKKLEARLMISFIDSAHLPNAFEAFSELSFSANVSVDYTRL
jgi:hypothetical protein